jgi:hypothetical protein
MLGHMHEKVDRDLFIIVGNLKKIKNCLKPKKFSSFIAKVWPNAHKNWYFIPIFYFGIEKNSWWGI